MDCIEAACEAKHGFLTWLCGSSDCGVFFYEYDTYTWRFRPFQIILAHLNFSAFGTCDLFVIFMIFVIFVVAGALLGDLWDVAGSAPWCTLSTIIMSSCRHAQVVLASGTDLQGQMYHTLRSGVARRELLGRMWNWRILGAKSYKASERCQSHWGSNSAGERKARKAA